MQLGQWQIDGDRDADAPGLIFGIAHRWRNPHDGRRAAPVTDVHAHVLLPVAARRGRAPRARSSCARPPRSS